MSYRERSVRVSSSTMLPKDETRTMIEDLNAKLAQIVSSYEHLSATMKKEEIERKEVCDGMNATIEADKITIRELKKEIVMLNKSKTRMVHKIIRLTTGPKEDQLNEKITTCTEEIKRRSTEDYEWKISEKTTETARLKSDLERLAEKRDNDISTRKAEVETLKQKYDDYQAEVAREIKEKDKEIQQLKAKLEQS
eukprot:TRINITY_DN3410_c0_g1_i6.p1 TRINITY_DN3410_c0_g1~~TRINITY_DN3410_c0_g1_i6.p1  ORF type:complete len:195 (-),score=54.92 TRINITY_DN3410_c0_g1_i6:63-647(-)